MRMTTRGRVTIPAALREKAGLRPGTEVEVVYEPDGTVLIMAKDKGKGRGDDIKKTTEEIMALMRSE